MKRKDEELDRFCRGIVGLLAMTGERIRFNDLHKRLNKHGLVLSKPTLSEHLKHLKKQKIILRKKEGIQTVTYQMNWGKFSNLEQTARNRHIIENRLKKDKGAFDSLTPEEQVTHVSFAKMIDDFALLKLKILNVLDPSNEFERSLQALFIERMGLKRYENWLIETCQKDKEFAKKAIEKIDLISEQFENEVFVKEELHLLHSDQQQNS